MRRIIVVRHPFTQAASLVASSSSVTQRPIIRSNMMVSGICTAKGQQLMNEVVYHLLPSSPPTDPSSSTSTVTAMGERVGGNPIRRDRPHSSNNTAAQGGGEEDIIRRLRELLAARLAVLATPVVEGSPVIPFPTVDNVLSFVQRHLRDGGSGSVPTRLLVPPPPLGATTTAACASSDEVMRIVELDDSFLTVAVEEADEDTHHPLAFGLMLHGSSNALSILRGTSAATSNGNNKEVKSGANGEDCDGLQQCHFRVPPPLLRSVSGSATSCSDTYYEGVYLTPSLPTALSYAGLTNSSSTDTPHHKAGVLVCAVRLGRIYNEFLEGPDPRLESQLAKMVHHRREVERVLARGESTGRREEGMMEVPMEAPPPPLDFDCRITWVDETPVYCVVDPTHVLPILCIQR